MPPILLCCSELIFVSAIPVISICCTDWWLCIVWCVSVLKPRAPAGPGEMGQAVIIPEAQQAEMKEKFKINQFNLMASDLISVNRSLKDVRMDA